MIVGYHVIIGAYGFWLPNDPRGSWSQFVGAWELFRFGKATKTEERRSVAARPHDHDARFAAKRSLKYPAVSFDEAQTNTIAAGFAERCEESGVELWACAIIPEHMHLVMSRPPFDVRIFVNQLKGRATRELIDQGIHPLAVHKEADTGRVPKCFGRGEWTVYLDPEDVPRAIPYVERNPEKEGRRAQHWAFIKTYIE